jgi:hypothetical protein
MTADQIVAYGTAAVAMIGAVGARVVDWRKARADEAERDRKAALEADAMRGGYRDAFIATLQSDREKMLAEHRAEQAADAKRLADERAATDASRRDHGDCLRLVGEMSGRVEMLEVNSQRIELALKECRDQHATTTADLRRVRERLTEHERRTSDPNIAAAKGGGQ